MSFDPIGYINTPRWLQQRLGLERIRALMGKLGDPQNDVRFVHVAGTNGKGSVCAYIARILESAGYRTGLFTSPYIERFEERIRIDGVDISPEQLLDVTLAVRDAADEVERERGEHPTEFELMTAVALLHFAQQGCDIAVMEVGLGGRLDSTNIIDPEVSIITRIGLDHTDILGDTIDKIAAEKAGIIKPGVPVVAYPQAADAIEVIERVCEERGCRLYLPDFGSIEIGEIEPDGTRCFSYAGHQYETSLLATYQPYNAALAIAAADVLAGHGWQISQADIDHGIGSAVWPGRFEVVCADPLFIVDGAHNPQGARELRASLENLVARLMSESDADAKPGRTADAKPSAVFVTGVLADKDHAGMLDAMLYGGAGHDGKPRCDASLSAPLFSKATFLTYTPDNPRALDAQSLAEEISSYGRGDLSAAPLEARACGSAEEASELAMDIASSDDSGDMQIIVAFGTLYAIGQIKEVLRRRHQI